MMVREYNSRNSTKKRKTTSAKRQPVAQRKVKKATPVRPVQKVAYKKTRKPVRKDGFIRQLFTTNRVAGEMDYTFLLLVGVLVVFGLIMLLSASTPTANVKFGRSYHFFVRQLVYVILGVVLMTTLIKIHY